MVELPVLDTGETFSWGIWVSLSATNFDRAQKLWNDPNRVNESSYFGWFSNSLATYPETLDLKTAVHSREVGLLFSLELEPTDRPLAVEQRDGITTARVREIAEQMHHRNEQIPKPRKKFLRLF